MRTRLLAPLLALLVVLASVTPAGADPADDLINELMCPASGASLRLASSNSAEALWMREFIRAKSAAGWSEQRIVDTLVRQYGERILPVPPREGFSLAAWVTPFAIIFGGAAVLGFTLSQWLRGQRGHYLIGGSTRVVRIDEADLRYYEAQLQQELEQFDMHGRA